MNIHEKIEQLAIQIAEMAKQHRDTSKMLLHLMDELEKLKMEAGSAPATGQSQPAPHIIGHKEIITPLSVQKPVAGSFASRPNTEPQTLNSKPQTTKTTVEEFVGRNLASKVGIVITLIGIFIGAKYAIEHNMVSPIVRITSGYISGLVLIGIAWRLKKRYEQYSSVLMGGGLAVLYFITYTAYSFYGLFPQMLAFALMLVFTVGSVYAALLYNRIIIAHLGLVGAYAIPILLSDNSGRYAVLFSYIAIINTGILVLSFKKYWKSLFYVSFVLTWLIYSSFFIFDYSQQHFTTGFVFLSIFFWIFYTTFLAYKLIKKEQYSIGDVILLLTNAFIFYGYGYVLLDEITTGNTVPGLFTLANAAIHFVVSMIVKRLQLADKALLYLLLGLVIVFITIAVPVQLDGNWVTLLWTVEALIVFYIGRTQQRTGYEKLAALLSILSFASLLEDWTDYSGGSGNAHAYFFNAAFFTGVLVCIAWATMIYLHYNRKRTETPGYAELHISFFNYVLPTLLLVVLYYTFELELNDYFNNLIWIVQRDELKEEVSNFKIVAILLYSIMFISMVVYANLRRVKSKILATAMFMVSMLCIAFLLLSGLTTMNILSDSYQSNATTYFGAGNLALRYLTMGMAGVLLWLGHRTIKWIAPDQIGKDIYVVFVQVAVLTVISFEYLQWMNLIGTSANEYKFGLSIVWSVYALMLVVMGINKKKKYWRLTGIFFFIITIIKLFVYDLSQATTISKTISFISLGGILLLVSYLYNRYKHVILEEDKK